MSEYYDLFVKLKKQMDDKQFVYDEVQPWEKNITNSINNSTFVKTINEYFTCLNSPDNIKEKDYLNDI